jgi:hypothetical protein
MGERGVREGGHGSIFRRNGVFTIRYSHPPTNFWG